MDIDALPESVAPLRRAALSPRWLALLVVGIGGVGVLTIAVCAPAAQWWTRSCGEHMTLAEAKGRVRLDLPEQASDIRFYQHLRPDQVVVVDFAITEDAFLGWAARQGWKPKRVVGGVTIWPRSAFRDRATAITVTDGYQYDTLRRGTPNTFSVTYDCETQRAYYQFSSEPHDGER